MASAMACITSFASASDAVPINLPAQSLDRDIRDLAQQAGITISFSRRALKKYQKAAFSGTYTPAESLDALLKDTDYAYQFVNENTVRIFKIKRKKIGRASCRERVLRLV